MTDEFFQLGYVTNDFERGIRELKALHAIGPFKEMRDLHLPTGPDREWVGHFALAFKQGIQFELIAPAGGDAGIYRDLLLHQGFALRFHHLGRFVTSVETYQNLLKDAAERWELPINYEAFGGFYAYADARKDLGHFLEYFTFPNADFFADVPRY
jgi:Glyoxalase/Bleomycin resistance protein/Dioxygenase superfamily